MITVGIDEVGRGCWAGPVVAGAVILNVHITGVADSKLLSKKKRESLDSEIREKATATGIGWVDAETVDEIGLSVAVALAMQRAIDEIAIDYDEVIIDGNINFLLDNPKSRAVIKADATVPSVSAASIIAKVARDDYMARQALVYPDYGFEQHVGYGTAQHRAAVVKYGVTNLHRRSVKPIKALLQ